MISTFAESLMVLNRLQLRSIVDDGCRRVAATQTDCIARAGQSSGFLTVEMTVKTDA